MIISVLDASGGSLAGIMIAVICAANADSAAATRVDQSLIDLAGHPSSGENSRTKLQNVVTDSTAVDLTGPMCAAGW